MVPKGEKLKKDTGLEGVKFYEKGKHGCFKGNRGHKGER